MLKLKLFLAFFLMHNAMFAWGQQTQLPALTPPAAAKSATNSPTAPKSKDLNASSNNQTDAALSGLKNASGLVCTIISGKFEWLSLSFVLSAYTTYMVEPSCDEDYYYKLTVASISSQSRVQSETVNIFRAGSHAYIMDVNLSTVRNPYFYIGNLRFSKTGEIHLSVLDALRKKTGSIAGLIDAPYSPYKFKSQIHYIWNIETLAHRLLAPNGDTYIMYSYTNEVSTRLTRDGLIDLKNQLNLPPGWKFENFLVGETITVRTAPTHNFIAVVLYDELNNFYVKYDP